MTASDDERPADDLISRQAAIGECDRIAADIRGAVKNRVARGHTQIAEELRFRAYVAESCSAALRALPPASPGECPRCEDRALAEAAIDFVRKRLLAEQAARDAHYRRRAEIDSGGPVTVFDEEFEAARTASEEAWAKVVAALGDDAPTEASRVE